MQFSVQDKFYQGRGHLRPKAAHSRVFLFMLAVGCACSLVGCGGSGLPIVPVEGRVTFDGGPCPTHGMVCFAPIEPAKGLPKRPGTGKFDTDGKFTVTTLRPGDGLIPGRYRVRIDCLKGPIDPFNPKVASHVADDYEWPELTIERDAREPVVVDYDVPGK